MINFVIMLLDVVSVGMIRFVLVFFRKLGWYYLYFVGIYILNYIVMI